MRCDDVRCELLNRDWDADERRHVAELLEHLQSCPECESALADFDKLRGAVHVESHVVEPPGGWSAFEERVTARAMRGNRLPWRIPLGVLSLAACLALAFIAGQTVTHRGTGPTVIAVQAAPSMTSQQINERVDLFRQVSDVFDRRTSWVLLSKDASDVGLGRPPEAATDRLLLVRLTVSREGAKPCTADLMIVPGQSADVNVPTPEGSSLGYHLATSKSEPNRLQLSVQFEPAGAKGRALALLATDLCVPPGQVTPAGEIVTTSGRYGISVEVHPVTGERL